MAFTVFTKRGIFNTIYNVNSVEPLAYYSVIHIKAYYSGAIKSKSETSRKFV